MIGSTGATFIPAGDLGPHCRRPAPRPAVADPADKALPGAQSAEPGHAAAGIEGPSGRSYANPGSQPLTPNLNSTQNACPLPGLEQTRSPKLADLTVSTDQAQGLRLLRTAGGTDLKATDATPSASPQSSSLSPTGDSSARQAAGGAGPVQVWLSTIDQSRLLSRQDDLQLASGAPQGPEKTITVNDQVKYQSMDGFGASITDASAFLLQKRLTPEARAAVMHDLFSRDGIHLSMVRQPMGSCDYNLNLFTYDDSPGDTELKNFSVDADKRFMLPSLKEALAENPELKVMASPWSAPGWMKTSGSIIGGKLKPENYQTYGEYFARFVESYQAEGVPIWAVTLQNEPLFEPSHYPCMNLPAQEEAQLIKQGVGPAFEAHGIKTKVMVYDHNFDRPDYPSTILDDPEAARYVAGVAWHGYGGSHESMSQLHDAHPDKQQWFTESSGGDWVPAFHDAFMDQTRSEIRVARNWGQSVMWWNLALDREHGPSLLGDWSTCRGLVTVDQTTGQVEHNVDYVTMGHLSKFVEPGARRIESNWFPDDLENVAFQNPDGSKVCLVSNRTTEAKTFRIQDGDRSFEYTLPGEAAATFKWAESS